MTTVVHCQKTQYDVYIGRDRENGELKYMLNTEIGERGWLGNPHPVQATASNCPTCNTQHSRQESIKNFSEDFQEKLAANDAFRDAVKALQGQTLGCWYKPKACHGDVIPTVVDRLNVTDA